MFNNYFIVNFPQSALVQKHNLAIFGENMDKS